MIFVLVSIKHDAHRNSLHHLYVVAGGVLRRKQTEPGTTCAANGEDFAFVLATGRVDLDLNRLSLLHVAQLRFFEVCRDPDIVDVDKRHQRLSWLNVLSHFGRTMADDPMTRRGDLRVLKI